MNRRGLCGAFLSALAAVAQQPLDRTPSPDWTWRMSYIHDEDRSSLFLVGLEAGGGGCAVAFGRLHTEGVAHPVALRTEDGGKAWEIVRLEDAPVSGFLLSKRLGWMVGSRGIWRSGDCGRTWKQVSPLKDMLRLYFIDENVGFAVGLRRQFVRTTDGGHHWTKVEVSDEPQAAVDRSSYSWIDFGPGKLGLAVGAHQPRAPVSAPRAPQPWLDPEGQLKRRQLPSLALLLQTLDGGATWRGSSMSVLGQITRVRLGAGGRALSLVSFPLAFDWPSEIYTLNFLNGETTRVFREKDRAVTDIALLPGGVAYAAGVEPPGTVRQLPIPGKVRIAQSLDMVAWREVDVDYRAMAGQVWLAAVPGSPALAATDTGMVLELVRRR